MLAVVVGLALVIDGDTLRIGSERIRLHGIDAPEISQTCQTRTGAMKCGDVARVRLAAIIAGREVRCTGKTRDRYRRLVATCTVRGEDIGRRMVREGWAMAYRRYSTAYVGEEAAARRDSRGLWATAFVQPGEYRKLH